MYLMKSTSIVYLTPWGDAGGSQLTNFNLKHQKLNEEKKSWGAHYDFILIQLHWFI